MQKFFESFYVPYYEGEDDVPTGDQSGDDPNPSDGEKKFSQADMDRAVINRVARETKKREAIIEQLETLQKSNTLSGEEKENLQKQIADLEAQTYSQKELSAKEKKVLESKHSEQLSATSTERDAWKSRFEESTIIRGITDVAVTEESVHPSQIVAMLRPTTRLVEVKDEDGNPTGAFEARVKFNGRDKEGKPTTLDLTVQEAVKQMKEMEEYGNLFKSGAAGGLGGGTAGKQKSGKIDYADSDTFFARVKEEGLDAVIEQM